MIFTEPKILFLLPQYGGQVTTSFFESMLEWAQQASNHGVEWNWIIDPGSTLLPMARSQLVALAMELDDWTHIIMSDSDMGFNVNDLCQLILADKDVIGAVAPVKAYPLATNASTGDGIIKEEGDLNQCNYVGSGLLCIKRETIEVLYDKYQDSLSFYAVDGHRGDQSRYKVIDLFATITNGGHETDPDLYLTEDYAFCKRVRDAGLEVWQHTKVNPSHTGQHTFSFKGEANMIKRYTKKAKQQ